MTWCDMDTCHVTWIHDMCHGSMTCDMDTLHLTEKLGYSSDHLGQLEVYG